MLKYVLICICVSLLSAQDPEGFQNIQWGAPAGEIQAEGLGEGWEEAENELFPNTPGIQVFSRDQTIAGYNCNTRFYFYEDQFFQATVEFDFSELENYDFNYNVFISVDEYYREIRSTTLTFVNDIYVLLRRKYGQTHPVFKDINPKNMFVRTDNYIAQERWNLRYNPSEYYKRIVTRGYAKWKFPKTEIIFSIDISAADSRFDYLLSASSVELHEEIEDQIKENRSQGL
jgi:hypothetical protein